MTNGIRLTFDLVREKESSKRKIALNRFFVAGWTGRDKAKMEEHIAELEALGVKRPGSVPVFYRVSIDRLTQRGKIQSPGNASSGEVEFVLVGIGQDIWIGVGSDHTDREVETYGITVSKQMCDKPVAGTLWPMTEVASHWDQLELKSYAVEDGERRLYQEGSVASMLSPHDLMAKLQATEGTAFQSGDVMMGGTMPAIGGIKSAERFEFELTDPVLGRIITHGYDVETLPING
jgi:2-keto-4-pentenoate hydratase/2-oxohepta-3-ene-1,7-dioic acid hydratase in catechol pathway